jgi:hypothetical protein
VYIPYALYQNIYFLLIQSQIGIISSQTQITTHLNAGHPDVFMDPAPTDENVGRGQTAGTMMNGSPGLIVFTSAPVATLDQ